MSEWNAIDPKDVGEFLFGGGTAVMNLTANVRIQLSRTEVEALLETGAIAGTSYIEGKAHKTAIVIKEDEAKNA